MKKQKLNLKSPTNDETWTTLNKSKKKFQDEELPHELFLTTRQKPKIRNAASKNVNRYKTAI